MVPVKRPVSITAIAVLMIFVCVASGISILMGVNNPAVIAMMAQNPIPPKLQYSLQALGITVTFLSSIGFLMGVGVWRWVYATWSLVTFVIAITTSPRKEIVWGTLVLTLVVLFFLFRPRADQFFKGRETAGSVPPSGIT
jgi:hypothetical protein